jgi:hypothetical protein
MDKEKLKQCVIRLEAAIEAHRGESEDVAFLATFDDLRKDIRDAKNNLINEPRDLGLGLGRL